MTWFFRWLNKRCMLARPVAEQANMFIRSEGMSFNFYRADGGYILEYNHYDEIKDKTFTTLHIITNEQDLGSSIGKIVTLEMLRN